MNQISNAKRVVVKVGTSTLTHKTGLLNIRRFEQLVSVLADLKNSGKEIILVSSGAIGVGSGKLGLAERPKDVPSKQACAAIGQCELMYAYDKLFSGYNHNVAQVLLTYDIMVDAKRKSNVINTFEALISFGSIPIVNENDTVSTEEVEFGDNDTLSVIVAEVVKANALIILSDIDGLYDKDPNKYENATLIRRVEAIDDQVRSLAGDTAGKQGTGGMISKLNAAERAMNDQIPMVVANGNDPHILYDIFDGKEVGTLFQKGEVQ